MIYVENTLLVKVLKHSDFISREDKKVVYTNNMTHKEFTSNDEITETAHYYMFNVPATLNDGEYTMVISCEGNTLEQCLLYVGTPINSKKEFQTENKTYVYGE